MVSRALDGDAPILEHLLGAGNLLNWLFDAPEYLPADAPTGPTQPGKAACALCLHASEPVCTPQLPSSEVCSAAGVSLRLSGKLSTRLCLHPLHSSRQTLTADFVRSFAGQARGCRLDGPHRAHGQQGAVIGSVPAALPAAERPIGAFATGAVLCISPSECMLGCSALSGHLSQPC